MQNKTLQKDRKDSGIAWIKEIPSDWGVLPIRSSLIERKEKKYAKNTASFIME